MSKPLVISVIVNWNGKQDLRECLDSLIHVEYEPLSIVVVDNGSSDGSVAFVSTHYPEVDVLSLPHNRGYAFGLNKGILRALEKMADYIFVLNNDTVIEPSAVSRLIEVMESEKTIGVAAPKVLYYDQPTKVYSLGTRSYRWLPLPVNIGHGKCDHQSYNRIMEFDYVTGCAMMVRGEIFHKIGFFDTSYYMYYEDADFCRRVHERGYRIVCVGSAIVYHKGARSTGKNKPLFTRIRARNRIWFYRRYRHGPHPWMTYGTLWLLSLLHSVKYIKKRNWELIIPYWQGLIEGWYKSANFPIGGESN
jgi:GT2 family glycosyltransferase